MKGSTILLKYTFAAVLCAAVGLLVSGCGTAARPPQQAQTDATPNAQQAPPPAPAPEANIYSDQAMLMKPYALIGGTVENISGGKMEGLSVEIELKRRDDGSTETREVEVKPRELAPGERGKFSLKVISDEWSSSRIVRLRSSSRPTEVAFKTLPGARRPPERLPDSIKVTRPEEPRAAKPKQKGDDFINTPDTAEPVP